MANKKPWFGKRWTKSLVGGADKALFNRNNDEEFETMASSFCINFTLGLVAGVVFAICTFFDNAEQLVTITTSVAGGLSLLLSAYFLYRTLGQLPSTGLKIGRSVFVVVLNLLSLCAGLFIGMWGAILAIACLVLYFIFTFCLNEMINQGKRETITVYRED